MVTGEGDLDDRGDPAEQFVHLRADLEGKQAKLAAKEGDPGSDRAEQLRRGTVAGEDPRVELPRPPAAGRPQGCLRDVVDDVGQVVVLGGDGAESAEGLGPVR